MNKENPSLENIIDNLREAAERNKLAAEINELASKRMEEVILRMAARMKKKKDVKAKSNLAESYIRLFHNYTLN